jgi:diacylglycerol kinase
MNQPTPQHPFKSKSFIHSLGYACNGLKSALNSERNLRTHTALTIMVLAAGVYYRVSRWEWAILLLCITLMVAVELLNTALEYLVDMLVDGRHNHNAKMVKDIAAGACLITAIGTAITGFLIFLPYLQGGF